MGSVDRLDERIFKVNFSNEGIDKLRETVRNKLKEFMGEYTDDTLVEYVIVLIRNGRRKEEARNELNVFLGDDSESFVAWLWDHLFVNLDLYVPPEDPKETTNTISLNNGQSETNESLQLDSSLDIERPYRSSDPQNSRDGRGGVAAGRPPLVSVVGNINFEERKGRKARHERSPSPRRRVHRKRSLSDDQHVEKEDAKLDLPRRLLQSAVRDALAIPRTSIKEPSHKRLRSVVATSASSVDTSLSEQPRQIQSVARALNPMATVIRAVAEAAEDVRKPKSTVSVFDRLSHSATNASELPGKSAELRDPADSADEYEDLGPQYETVLESKPMSCDDGIHSPGHKVTGYLQRSMPAVNGGERLKMSPHIPVDDSKGTGKIDMQDLRATAVASYKIGSNVSKRTLPNNQRLSKVREASTQNSGQEGILCVGESTKKLIKENRSTVGNVNGKSSVDAQKGAPKIQTLNSGTISGIRLLEDANSRTIFVNNVHFGATKDSLSRHFNKFGEVLKVFIVSDPATGQPMGSAYVEFMRKEAADNALSLDGTSFMSRILKIVKKSTAPQDAATTIMTWSRGGRGSPYSISRFPRPPFLRGMPGGFRARPPVRPGGRSMQWKRGAPAPNGETQASPSVNTLPVLPGRGLTYVRPESKLAGNTGALGSC